jgi:hypothetical protein
MKKRSYLAAAFNARPLGMPVPPNWFGLAAFGLLGAFLGPGFLLIGAGLEVGYLAWLSRSARFRAAVDAAAAASGDASSWDERRARLLEGLDAGDRRRQQELEARCAEIADGLHGRTGGETQVEGLSRLAWLHLRLLAARAALRRVAATARADTVPLDRREADLRDRLARQDLDPELRRTLEQEAEVIEARRKAHLEAGQRLERVDAEIERIAQQVALVREQALLATDEAQVADSVDALAASLNEANRWLLEDRDVFAGLELDAGPPPDRLFGRPGARPRSSQEEEP